MAPARLPSKSAEEDQMVESALVQGVQAQQEFGILVPQGIVALCFEQWQGICQRIDHTLMQGAAQG